MMLSGRHETVFRPLPGSHAIARPTVACRVSVSVCAAILARVEKFTSSCSLLPDAFGCYVRGGHEAALSLSCGLETSKGLVRLDLRSPTCLRRCVVYILHWKSHAVKWSESTHLARAMHIQIGLRRAVFVRETEELRGRSSI